MSVTNRPAPAIAVFCVMYPEAERYIGDFRRALEAQDIDIPFSLFVVDDGLGDVERRLASRRFSVTAIEGGGSMVANRNVGMECCTARGYDYIVLADADDLPDESRLSTVLGIFADNADVDIVVNDVVPFPQGGSGEGAWFSRRFVDGQRIGEEALLEGNCIGFGNSAFRVESIKRRWEKVPEGVVAYDWAFYFPLVEAGAWVEFTNRTATRYRQHDRNTIGRNRIAKESLIRAVEAKLAHYRALGTTRERFREMAQRYARLLQGITASSRDLDRYHVFVEVQARDDDLWWESIRLETEMR